VRSYAGYVRLPPSVLRDVGNYTINTFFWYFEARNNPRNAPLSIYLAGGPGASSTFAAADGESGPCLVNSDANSTSINPFSFNNHVNMLYIDQPVQTGFSYDSLINGTLDYSTGLVTPLDFSPGIPAQNRTVVPGIFASQNPATTVNTTLTGAKALWHFAESWLNE
jgi:Serine carboxypeptidase